MAKKKIKKTKYRLNHTLKCWLLFITVVFLVMLQIYNYAVINFNISQIKILIGIYSFLKVIFGSFYTYLYFILLIYAIFITFFNKATILFKNRSIFLYISIILYIILSNFSYYRALNLDLTKRYIQVSRKLLEIGINKEANGLLGSLLSLTSYKFLLNKYIYLGYKILFYLSLFIFFSRIIPLLIKSLIQWIKYINSEEYKNRKEKIKLIKQVEKEKQQRQTEEVKDNISSFLVNMVSTKLDKKEKSISLDKEEQEKINKQYRDLIMKSSKENNAIKEEKSIEIEDTQKDEEKYNFKHINPEEYKISEEIEDDEKNENIFEEIDNIFIHKEMDNVKKREMITKIEENIHILEDVLSKFKIEAKVINYAVGPTITRYELKIPVGSTKVKSITSLSSDIALSLAAESIRIEAPIPGTNLIGIEVPNKIKEGVYFSNLIKDEKLNELVLPAVLGKNIVGEDTFLDISTTPHLLISGTTGSGKSVFINSIISTIISKKTKDEVKFILIDPKMVELSVYNDIPHLLTPVITEPDKAASALKWAVNEMEERYREFSSKGYKNIAQYNKSNILKKPYIVIIIDELADLMMVAASSVELSIARITQKARAVGIHIIVATQRPSIDIVTGVIKSNLPSRISFALRSQVDSRTILDQVGAEKLLGNGDMLLLRSNTSKLERIQGAYITDEEIIKITDLLKSTNKVEYNFDITEQMESNEKDSVYNDVVEYIKNYDQDRISISKIQQEFKMGFNRTSRIFSDLRNDGIIDENNYIVYKE